MQSYLTAEISASAVAHNLDVLAGCVGDGVKLCAVVKANCYGHGVDLLLDTLARKADWLAVASPDEAIALREMGYTGPVLMFFSACAYVDGRELRDALAELIQRDVTLTVVSPPEAEAVEQAARRAGRAAQVHVKIDTGMTRSGVVSTRAVELIDDLRRREGVQLTGAYTHLASADESDKTFTYHQLENFRVILEGCRLERDGRILHAANSAATIDIPDSHLDMVRPGIAVYGYQPSDHMARRLPLRPCLRLTGRLLQVKDVPAHSRCGYGLTYEFLRDSRVGLVPVGYGDGYLRRLSSAASMSVRGRLVPVRGRVSMDQVIVDLTEVPQAAVGDEVEIISPDPDAPHSVAALARLADTLPSDITCLLGPRGRRVLVD